MQWSIIFVSFTFLWFITSKIFRFRSEKKKRQQLEKITSMDRGTRAERELILTLLKSGISSKAIFHDLYIKKYNERFCQIDLVVPTKVGILVFEVKDYSGWIFGDGRHQQWTKILAYGNEKYKFYNPIIQNNKHILDLKKQIKENIPFYSIIVFYGNCELKEINFVPNGTFITKSERVIEVIENIMENNKIANYLNKIEIVRLLKQAVKNGQHKAVQDQHVESITEMLGQDRIFR